MTKNSMKTRIAAALGETRADLVLKNARIFNVFTQSFEQGDLAISNGYFVGIGQYEGNTEIDATGKTIVPGFIDAHMHIESSIVTPAEYCKAVLPHGTSCVIADPHEIANVCGTAGIEYILESSRKLPIDFYIMMPSCVPATSFDETGYEITSQEIDKYLSNDRIKGLAEMMNYPGVVIRDDSVMDKILVTKKHNKLIDGHAPLLSDQKLNAYITSGIYSEHECTSLEEAMSKLSRGQWIMVREGTASKNLKELLPLFEAPFYNRCMLATDDKHPGELAKEGHIDYIIKMAIALGAKAEHAYTMASLNAATYFGLKQVGAICPGYRADFVVLNDFSSVDINSVYKKGNLVADLSKKNGKSIIAPIEDVCIPESIMSSIINTVKIGTVDADDFALKRDLEKVIEIVPETILTKDAGSAANVDTDNDILKLAVVERHHNTGHIGVCFVKGYGLKSGAVATSIAHDSHNIIVIGANDADMACAVNKLKELQGGMIVINEGAVLASLPLPIAGLMSDMNGEATQEQMDAVKEAARSLGVHENIDPFMTMSFLSLPVVPSLRLTTLGVVAI